MLREVAPSKTGQGFSTGSNTERMRTSNLPSDPNSRVLSALLILAQNDEPIDLFSLSEEAGTNLYRTLAALDELAQAGWVDRARWRLTLQGLAAAVALEPARDVAAPQPFEFELGEPACCAA